MYGLRPTGRPGHHDRVLTDADRALLASTRRAVLATIAPDGQPRLVPICFVIDDDAAVLFTPLDDKPKRGDDPLMLARVRDIRADPRVTVLVDRWDEDWTELAWLRCEGRAELVEPVAPGHAAVVAALRAKYPQYARQAIDARPLISITIERVTGWDAGRAR